MHFKHWLMGLVVLPILTVAGCQKPMVASPMQSQMDAHAVQTPTKNDDLSKLNYQSGQSPVIEINHNRSTLNPNDWKSMHIKYQNLDSLNRTSNTNTAYLTKQNVANDNLRVAQTFQPTGWHQKFINNNAIINRGHLIAYSLSKGIDMDGKYDPKSQSGDQDNPKNLFTQTAFANQKVQTIYESKVRNALNAGKKVIYQVHPIFRGNDLMPKGVQLQAITTDKTLDFNVYIYNVQPGIKFNYATGRSALDDTMQVPTPNGAPNFNDGTRNKTTQKHEVYQNGDFAYHPKHHYIRDGLAAYGAYHVAKHLFHHRR